MRLDLNIYPKSNAIYLTPACTVSSHFWMDVTHSYLILLCHFITQNQKLWYSPETFRLSFYSIQGVPKKFELNQSKENFGFNSRFPKFGYDLTLGKLWNYYLTFRKPRGRPQTWLLNPVLEGEILKKVVLPAGVMHQT